ncbi:MAG TPA: histidine phosphatase family protein [Vicinamibacterales bacterium]|nr:histidine phosphatase family protein [Vicinamibacterales bacterium]
MTRFYLIRHGHTAAVDHYIAGRAPGTDLTDEGQRQARELAVRMRHVPLIAVLSSPLERTRQTAEPLARDHGLDVIVVPELNEIDFGAWSGSTFTALDEKDAWRRYNIARAITMPDGGELLVEVQARAVRTLLTLRDRHAGGHVAVVSHGDVIRALLLYFLGMPVDFVHRIEISPARVSIVDLSDESVRLLLMNGDTVP